MDMSKEDLQKQKQNDEFLADTKNFFDILKKLGISNFM